jgi:tRNA threonylcarbamoyl adenosine modification protein (Sua5/YciO/YrdC/YwlC family)
MLLEINPENVNNNYITRVVEVLKKGGVIIFPTDSVYAMGCDLYNKKALEKLAKLKGVKLNKANFAIICSDFSNLSNYVKQIDKSTFKLMNTYLPGPFTFILQATNEIPRLFDSNRKEIGIRIPDNKIATSIVEELGSPLATTSLKDIESFLEYHNDPSEIYEHYSDKVDLIIDGGFGKLDGTTVIDCSKGDAVIIRQGLGQLE